LHVTELPIRALDSGEQSASAAAVRLMGLLARELPNEARVEMIRVSRDREAQVQIAQVLVKSTSAISAAIGAQPIPLA
jgi:GTPase Era involved in 16S rRNA processing